MNEAWKSICQDVPVGLFPEPLPEPKPTLLSVPDRPIHSIVFAFEGVLYDDTAWRRWLLLLAARMGLQTRYASFFRIWDCEFAQPAVSFDDRFWSSIETFLREAGLSRGQIDEIEAASRGRLRHLCDEVRPFPAVRQAISRLAAAGIEPCVLAPPHCGRNEASRRLRKLGLHDHIHHVLALPPESAVLDRAEGIRRITARMASPCHTAFVGRQTDELQAAGEAGMLTIAFNHDADARADWYIEHFEQLEELRRYSVPARAAG